MATFDIPDDFRAFMQQVVAYLDVPGEEKFLDGEEALQDEVGYGGRLDGRDTYRFVYITRDGLHRWELVLRESQIREIADGLLIDTEGECHDLVRTKARKKRGILRSGVSTVTTRRTCAIIAS
jgi:hypothetical protein